MNTKHRSFFLEVLVSGALSIWVCALGLWYVVGWHTHFWFLEEISPSYAPIPYNAALGFVLAGIAMLTLLRGSRFTARVLAVIICLIGLVTLIEYFFGLPFDIDEFLVRDYVHPADQHPGRMSPISALNIYLSGVILLALSSRYPSKATVFATVSAASFIIALAVVAFTGHLAVIEGGYGLSPVSQMTMEAAAGFASFAIAASIIALASPQIKELGWRKYACIPISAAVAAFSIGISQAMEENAANKLESQIEQVRTGLAEDIRKSIDDQVGAIHQITSEWMEIQIDTGAWQGLAIEFLERNPQFQSVSWVDQKLELAWSVPNSKSNVVAEQFNLLRDEKRSELIDAVLGNNRIVATSANLTRGGSGIVIMIPLYPSKINYGLLVGELRTQELVRPIVKEAESEGLLVCIEDNDRLTYTTDPVTPFPSHLDIADVHPISYGSMLWELRVWPSEKLKSERSSIIPTLILIIGVIFAFAIFLFVYFAPQRKRKSDT